MSIDLPAAALEYLQARRARGYLSRDHAWLISSFLDGLAAQNATTITRANVLAFATAPIETGRAWQAFRLSTIRGFAAYVHDLDPDVAEVIPEGLIPATYARRIPYLYSVALRGALSTTGIGCQQLRSSQVKGLRPSLHGEGALRQCFCGCHCTVERISTMIAGGSKALQN